MLTTATIEILSQLNATLSWESTGSLGTVVAGQNSELYVKANLTTSSFTLRYNVTSGALPPGLTLKNDGTISGIVPISTSTPIASTYTFNISAIDITGYTFIEDQFSITVNQTTSTEYINLLLKPLMKKEKRDEYKNFVLNQQIFDPSLIYRPLDPNFGVQKELKLVVHFGVKKLLLNEYVDIINQNFYKRRFQLGKLKLATGKLNDQIIHELIYIDVIDRYTHNDVSIPDQFTFNGVTYYPAGVNNMRSRIASTTDQVDTFNPRFMQSKQNTDPLELGFIKHIPLCFVHPGKSSIILRRIKDSNFKFNNLDFEIDRIFVPSSKDYLENKYLLLERNYPVQ